MGVCECPRIDGFRIRRKGCPVHNECLDRVGPIPKLGNSTYSCTKPVGHEMPHAAPDGTWWEPPAPAPRAALTTDPSEGESRE